MERSQNKRRRVARIVGVVCGAGLAVLLTALALLRTDVGRAGLVRALAWYLSRPGETEVTIARLEGALPHHIELFGVSLRDAEGEWLTLQSAVVEWRPLALLRRRLHLTRLDVSGLHLSRFPAKGDGREAPVDLGWVRLPLITSVDRFRLEDIVLGEAVLGARASVRATGEMTAAPEGVVRKTVVVERTDGPPGRAEAKISFDPQTDRLGVHLDVVEPPGGVIARALHLAGLPAVSVRIRGDGPLEAWEGKLTARAGSLLSIDADLRVARADGYLLRAEGRADVMRAVGEPIRSLLAPTVAFQLAVGFAGDESLTVPRGRLASDAATLDLAGRVHPGRVDLTADLRLTETGMRVVNGLWAPVTARGLTLTGLLSGPVDQSTIRLDVSVTRPSLPGASARSFQGFFTMQPNRPSGAVGLFSAITGQGRLEGLRLARPAVDELFGETLDWAVEGTLDVPERRLDLARVEVTTALGRARGSGTVRLAGRPGGHGVIELTVEDLARVGSALNLPLRGAATVEASVESGDVGRGLSVGVAGSVRNLAFGDAAVDTLLGSRVLLAARIATSSDGAITVDDVRIEGKMIALEGAASLSPGLRMLDGRYSLRVHDLAPLSRVSGTALGGGATVDGTIRGDSMSPELDGSFSLTGARLGEVDLGSVRGRFARARVAPIRGHLSVTLLDPPFGPAEAAADVTVAADSGLRVSDLSIHSRESDVRGAVAIPLTGGPMDGALSGSVASLAPWSQIAGHALQGTASFTVRLRAEGSRQAVDLRLDGNQVAVSAPPFEGVRVGRLHLSADLIELAQVPRGRFSLEAWDARVGSARLTRVTVSGEAPSGATVNARLEATGDFHGPIRVNLAGGVSWAERVLEITLERLDATHAEHSLVMEQPSRITYGPGLVAMEPVALAVDGGRIVAQGRMGEGRIAGSLDVTKIPLSLAAMVWPGIGLSGTIGGEVRVEGPIHAPSGRIALALADARLASAWQSDLPTLAGTLEGDWRGGRLRVHGDMSGLADSTFTIRADLPLRGTATPLAIQMPAGDRVVGRVVWRGEIAPVWELLLRSDDRVRGRADVTLEVDGTVGAPRLGGSLAVTKGEYENPYSGTLIRELELAARLEGNRLVLTRVTGTDGGAGRFTGGGTVELEAARDFPMAVKVQFQKATLLRRDEITAVATGLLEFEGTVHHARLSGRIDTDTVEARLITALPREVVELDVIEVNAPDAPVQGKVGKTPGGETLIRLDVLVRMPRQVFLRGRGLDSEWAGELSVGGTTREPIIEGVLRPVRGEFTFAGKTFKLGEGSVRFDGADRIDPTLDLAAEHQIPDLTAVIRVGGRASRPDITLTSEPLLPQSEIASRVLFGKTSGQLNPIEALQIAEAIASLSGGQSRSVLDFARRTLGVDVLRVEGGPDGAGGVGVTVGKYLTEKVYIGVSQGIGPGPGSATVEVEVTPSITLERNVGHDGRSDIGIKWRWDY